MQSTYREYQAAGGLASVAACAWESKPAAARVQLIVPDGCVDLIWLAERELVIAGADVGPRGAELPAGMLSSGIRLRPGAAGAVLGCPASEILSCQVDAALVWGSGIVKLAEQVARAAPAQRIGLLGNAIARRNGEPDVLVVEAARRLGAAGARVAVVAADLGVSERQLHRRTVAAVGYGPKMLARVVRLRRLVALNGEDSLVARSISAGYASQSHMSSEVLRLTGMTPVRFLKDATLTAG